MVPYPAAMEDLLALIDEQLETCDIPGNQYPAQPVKPRLLPIEKIFRASLNVDTANDAMVTGLKMEVGLQNNTPS